jgi:glycosyltransferase involved in cell wall biosynthesis
MKPQLLIICNVLDDSTRTMRGITTDSPAASRKILMLCKSLKEAGIKTCILSLGRGRADGSLRYFRWHVRRLNGITIIYLPFTHVPFFSELLSLIAPLFIIWKFRVCKSKAVLFYNRNAAYLAALFFSRLLAFRNILDLEDGEVITNPRKLKLVFVWAIQKIYDLLCSNGALLACSTLTRYTAVRPTLNYYGVTGSEYSARFESSSINVLYGGSLYPETGADLLIQAIKLMRSSKKKWVEQINFEVTGKGSSENGFFELSLDKSYPLVNYHGRTTDEQYLKILNYCDVGLALKLNDGPLAHSTFPSKVVEFAASGMLVVTTDISDVKNVLGDNGALFLVKDDPHYLMALLEKICLDSENAKKIAKNGCQKVRIECEPESSGRRIAKFLFGM